MSRQPPQQVNFAVRSSVLVAPIMFDHPPPDWRVRLQAVQALEPSQPVNPEVVQSLLRVFREEQLWVVWEVAKAVARLGNRSVIPYLIQEEQACVDEFNNFNADRRFGYDASEEQRLMAVAQARIWLLTPAECESLLETASEFEKGLVHRKQRMVSLEEFWGG